MTSIAAAVWMAAAIGLAIPVDGHEDHPVPTETPGRTATPTNWPGPTEQVIPVVVPTPTLSPTVEGIASWMPEQYGRDYLALPQGRGWRVAICGAGGCWRTTSNDAGPDLAMQRRGRIADLAVIRWEQVCGVSRRLGLCPVTITYEGRSN